MEALVFPRILLLYELLGREKKKLKYETYQFEFDPVCQDQFTCQFEYLLKFEFEFQFECEFEYQYQFVFQVELEIQSEHWYQFEFQYKNN
ncbi:unnamed protein product [Nesidiocoris tenuis]|uniref:Uncharacterized protein n=1 Tax=Nesidiocoris tenuis TaxID=355587 RepID=A0A6H5GI89_9HEMI|nr:unnamed protein product [Nesidiocoris tenuis]